MIFMSGPSRLDELKGRGTVPQRISIHVEDPTSDDGVGQVTVGWFLAKGPEASVIYEAPKRVRFKGAQDSHPKSVSRCPAVLGFEARLFEVTCPIDVSLSFVRMDDGRPMLRAIGGTASATRPNKIVEMINLADESEWRHPDRPVLQMTLPYVFVSDAPVVINQLPPFLHYTPHSLPGTMFSGRFPIHIWPRPLLWSFEGHDLEKPLMLKRGQPLYYVQCETSPQDRAVQLVEVELTKELEEYTSMIAGAVNYVSQTFSLMKTAAERRPSQLVKQKTRT